MANTNFSVADIHKGQNDSQENKIEEVYSRVPPKYAVYRTSERVVIQYADDSAKADEQRQNMATLNLVRAQISGLTADWTKSKLDSFRERSAKYDGRVASALILCLEGDGAAALASLNEIKEAILAERTSWGRFEYLISASILCAVSIGIFTFVQHNLFPFRDPSSNLWLAARAGTVGAVFSIALAIHRRTVLTSLHRRDNIADAALRIVIGVIAAGVLVLIFNSKLLPNFKIGDASISGTDVSWQVILVIGFVAGFLERLVPDLLEQTAATKPTSSSAGGDNSTPGSTTDRIIPRAGTDRAAADKTAAEKAAAEKAAADKAAVEKAAAEKAAADKATAEKAAAEKAAADKATAEKAAAEKAAAEKAAAEKAAANKAAVEKAAAEKTATDKAAAERAAAEKAAADEAKPAGHQP